MQKRRNVNKYKNELENEREVRNLKYERKHGEKNKIGKNQKGKYKKEILKERKIVLKHCNNVKRQRHT